MQSPEIQKLRKEKIMLNIEENMIIIRLYIVKNGIVMFVLMEKNYTLRGKWSHLGH